MSVNYEKQINQYVQLNLSWNIKRMLLINKIGITVKDLIKSDAIDNLIIFIMFGLKEHDLKRALDILESWVELFGEYKTLRTLIVMDLKDKFGFIKEQNKDDDIEDIFEEDPTEQKELTHDEVIKIEKENLEYVIKVYMKAGYSYEQALDMNMSNFDFFNNYILEQREQLRADLHRLSYWIALGINNPDEFNKTVGDIRIRPLTREEKIAEIKNNTKAMFNELKEAVDNNG